jgi:hypothetical protein
MVPPAVQSPAMVPGISREMDLDTQEAMVALGYEQVTPEMLGYEEQAPLLPPDMGYEEAPPDPPDMGYGEAAPDMGYEEAAPDMGYGDAAPDMGYGDAVPDADMGYEEAEPDMGYGPAAPEIAAPAPGRRTSMSAGEQTQRRASIKAIMADTNISPMAKRRSIHHLMDGRRQSVNGGSNVPAPAPNLGEDSKSSGLDHHENNDEQQHHGFMGGHSICNEKTKHAEQNRPPCNHYDRKCTLIAPCCNTAFGCRICHDDCPQLPPKIQPKPKASKSRYHRSASLPSSFTSMAASQPEDTHHTIDRFAIKEVICRECFTRQSSKTYVYHIPSYSLSSIPAALKRTKHFTRTRVYPHLIF